MDTPNTETEHAVETEAAESCLALATPEQLLDLVRDAHLITGWPASVSTVAENEGLSAEMPDGNVLALQFRPLDYEGKFPTTMAEAARMMSVRLGTAENNCAPANSHEPRVTHVLMRPPTLLPANHGVFIPVGVYNLPVDTVLRINGGPSILGVAER